MAYKRVGWTNNGGKPLNSTNLAHIEEGIEHCVCKDSDAENVMQSPIELRNLTLGNLENENEAISKKYLDAYIDNYVKTRKDNTWRDYEFDIVKNQWNKIDIDGNFTYIIFWGFTNGGKYEESITLRVEGMMLTDDSQSKIISPINNYTAPSSVKQTFYYCNIIKIVSTTGIPETWEDGDFVVYADVDNHYSYEVYVKRVENSIYFYPIKPHKIFFSVI